MASFLYDAAVVQKLPASSLHSHAFTRSFRHSSARPGITTSFLYKRAKLRVCRNFIFSHTVRRQFSPSCTSKASGVVALAAAGGPNSEEEEGGFFPSNGTPVIDVDAEVISDVNNTNDAGEPVSPEEAERRRRVAEVRANHAPMNFIDEARAIFTDAELAQFADDNAAMQVLLNWREGHEYFSMDDIWQLRDWWTVKFLQAFTFGISLAVVALVAALVLWRTPPLVWLRRQPARWLVLPLLFFEATVLVLKTTHVVLKKLRTSMKEEREREKKDKKRARDGLGERGGEGGEERGRGAYA